MSSRLIANPVDAAALADELARFRIVDPGRLTDLMAEFPGGGATALAGFLVRRGALNHFQAERALAGGARWLNLGPYRLIGEANHGTFGPVYTALHRDKPGEFRLRMFPLRSLWRARQAKQIARALVSPPHPSVVPLIDADSANGLHYLVWPHAEGTPLATRVAPGKPMPIGEVVGLLVHLTNALHACHMLRVAHGTITPQAIVLGIDGLPQLLEHGAGAILAENLAVGESLLDTLSATVAMENVLEYAAPEFVTTPGPPTAAADQYALGAVCYFALTGHAPFPAGTRTDQLRAKLNGPPRPLAEANPNVPETLAAVIDRMLRPNPSYRFAALNEARNQLAVLDGWSGPTAEVPVAVDTVLDLPPPEPEGRYTGTKTKNEVHLPVDCAPEMLSLDSDDGAPGPLPVSFGETKPESALPTGKSPGLPTPAPAPPPTAAPAAPASSTPAPPAPASPSSPPRPSSPGTKDKAMAKLTAGGPVGAEDAPKPPKPPKKNDPRTSVGAPFHYHTEPPADPSTGQHPGLPETPDPGEPPVSDSVMWKRVKRNLLFWRPATDVVQVSVFGPSTLPSGQSAKVSVYLHTPDTSESVNTLCRAFHHEAVLIATGYVSREIAREETLAVHFSVANAGVSKSTLNMVWRGQPHRLVFELHVPWEAPGGPAPGIVSVGIDNVRIGKVEFRLQLAPRKS
jgi:serine/threonine protein kinase